MRTSLVLIVVLGMASMAWANDPKPADSPGAANAAEGEAKEAHGEGEHGAAAGESHEKTYFGIPGGILKFINIVLFIGFLVWILKGPALNAFNARTEEIRRQAVEARERREKADSLAADIQARLSQIEAEVVAIRQRAEAEGERQHRELLAAAEVEAAKILQSARNEVENRLKFARKELTEYAGELAATRAESILREKITPEDQRKLFRDSLTQVEEA